MSKFCTKETLALLSEADKNRLALVFLSSDNPMSTVGNWQAATDAMESASVESMKKMVQTALKKIEKGLNGEDTPSKPRKAAPNKTPGSGKGTGKGRKRKTEDNEEADADGEATPSKKVKEEPLVGGLSE